MKFIVIANDGRKIYDIQDKFIVKSPYLEALLFTKLGVDRDPMTNEIIIDIRNIDKYISIKDFDTYTTYLSGKVFNLTPIREILFDYFGTSNEYQYPLDFWAVKLHDNWIRNNFYSENLCKKNPYYGLVEISIPDNRKEFVTYLDSVLKGLGNNIYIAGGAALYIAGYVDKYSDIDIFVTKKNILGKFIVDNLDENDLVITDNSMSVRKFDEVNFRSMKFQFIRRLYTCPSEIVHGFDLDCCGILYDGKRLWATKRTVYSLSNKINWFDPQRVSPSYGYRLAKYCIRGFEIGLPFFDKKSICNEKVQNIFTQIWEATKIRLDNMDPIINWDMTLQEFNSILSELKTYFSDMDNMRVNSLTNLSDSIREYQEYLRNKGLNKLPKNLYGWLYHYYSLRNSNIEIPSDSMSIIVLANYYGFFVHNNYIHDYEVHDTEKVIRLKLNSNAIKYIDSISMKEQNPMEQVSGTFFPEPIHTPEDLITWYESSPLVYPCDVEKPYNATKKTTDVEIIFKQL